MGIGGDIAPEQKRDSVRRTTVSENAHCIGDSLLVLRKEDHRHRVVAFFGKDMPVLLRFLPEETMRHLEQNACTIAGVPLKADATTMLEVNKHRKGIVEHLMRFQTVKLS